MYDVCLQEELRPDLEPDGRCVLPNITMLLILGRLLVVVFLGATVRGRVVDIVAADFVYIGPW